MIPGGAAHVLREDPRRRDAADEVGGEVTVQDAQAVLRRHRERRAGGHGLLAIAVIEGARDLALAVEAHRALLDATHQEHRAQQPDSVLQLQVLVVPGRPRRDLYGPSRVGRHSLAVPFRPWPARDLRPTLDRRAAPGSPGAAPRPGEAEVTPRHAETQRPESTTSLWAMEGAWLARARWRRRGAWLRPAFVVLTVVDAYIGYRLPVAGDSATFAGALIAAVFLNLIAAIVMTLPLGALIRRRRPDLPKVVARDRAGTFAVLLVTAGFLGLGLAHHRRSRPTGGRCATRSSGPSRGSVTGRRSSSASNLDHLDTYTIEPGRVYRTCVPNRAGTRTYCVVVRRGMPFAQSVQFAGYEPNSIFAQGTNWGACRCAGRSPEASACGRR